MSRKLQEKQDRRLAEKHRREAQRRAARRGNLITIAVAVVVAAVVGVSIFLARAEEDAPVGGAAAAAGCTDVATHPSEGRQHVDDGTDVGYETSPPTSGNHYENYADPGFYPDPVPEEALVHNLEHGQIVIWYRPDAPQDVLADIESLVEQQPVATLAAPYEDLDEPYNFALTAWGASMPCERVSQDVVDRFRARFQGRGPENVGVPTF